MKRKTALNPPVAVVPVLLPKARTGIDGLDEITGGGLPAQLWKQVMLAAHHGLPARPLLTPEVEPAYSSLDPGGIGHAAIQAAGEAAQGVGNAIDGLIKNLFGK